MPINENFYMSKGMICRSLKFSLFENKLFSFMLSHFDPSLPNVRKFYMRVADMISLPGGPKAPPYVQAKKALGTINASGMIFGTYSDGGIDFEISKDCVPSYTVA